MLDRPARTRLPQDLRREQLIEAAITAIAEHGLSNVTLDKVARLAGLTAGMVNFHFQSKQELLHETLQKVADEYRAACEAGIAAAGTDPAAGLMALVAASFDRRIADPRKLAVWYAFWGESRSRDDYMTICGSADRAVYEAALGLIGELALGAGSPIDVRAAALGLCGLIDQLSQEALIQGEAFDHADAIETCRRYLGNLLPGGFAARGEAAPARRDAGDRDEGAPEHAAQGHAPRGGASRDLDPVSEDGEALPLTLPSWTYRDPAFSAREVETIHRPAWQMMGHVSELKAAGDYVTLNVLGKRVFAVRGDEGEIRAFHNVCRHRAHAVVEGHAGSCAGVIRCPYHAWTYDTQGVLKGIAASRTFPKLDKDNLGLFPVECEVFMGFVFVRLAPGGPSVAERYAPYRDELAAHRLEELEPIAPYWEGEIAADWKNVWDNYLEDYHFPTGHPGLSGLMQKAYDREPDGATRTIRLAHEMRDRPVGGWATRAYANLLPEVADHLPAEMRKRWSYLFLYPAVSLELYPDLVDFFHIVPLGPGRSLLRWRAYARPDARPVAKAVRWLNQRINYQVHHEDGALTESVQRNLETGAYERGVLSDMEVNVKALHDWVRADLPEADLPEADLPAAERPRAA